uniref:Lysyl oxidase homolog n=2 Tax=Sinocyclocheilus grahami TaxID=75366 RepID=A0A672JVL1_SINGR
MELCQWWRHIVVFLLHAWIPSCFAQTTPPVRSSPTPTPQTAEGPETLKFRLSGFPRKHNEGRIEVFYKGEWGTICDDDFSLANAHVLCRQLGFVSATGWTHSAKYGKGTGKIWLDNVQCSGSERSVSVCKSRGWGNSDCTHDEDAGVICKDERLLGYVDSNVIEVQVDENKVEEVRLRPVFTIATKRMPVTEGVVEVKNKDGWAQICDNGWTPKNSHVICGMMGFPHEKKVNKNFYKWSALPSHVTTRLPPLESEASEVALCCSHSWAAQPGSRRAISSCAPGRMATPSPDGPAGLETFRSRSGIPVCLSRNLSLYTILCIFTSMNFALCFVSGLGPIHMNEVHCTGHERSLWNCRYKNITAEDCKHTEDASVRCNVPYMGYEKTVRILGGRTRYEGRVEVLYTETNGTLRWGLICGEGWGTEEAMVVCRQLGLGYANHGLQVRLSGGRSQYEGRVEVRVGQRWGSVCSEGWTTKEAMVACRQLGLGFSMHAITETWYWDSSNVTEMVMSGVKCTGDEMSLSQCQHHRTVSCQKAAARFSAGVICSETASDLVLNASLVQQTTYIEDRPLHMLYCAAEEDCLSKSAAKANWPYGHRRLLRFSSQIHNIGRADFRPKAGRHSWVWHACHGMDIFTHYDLMSANGTKVAEGHKASFCLEDTDCDEGVSKRYECANFGEQGITVGCWDLYRHDIDCQWIDITDVKPGNYILQVVINPNYEVAESDFTNNAMKCNCKYDGHRIWIHNCHIGDAFSEEAEKKFEKYPGQLNNQIS